MLLLFIWFYNISRFIFKKNGYPICVNLILAMYNNTIWMPKIKMLKYSYFNKWLALFLWQCWHFWFFLLNCLKRVKEYWVRHGKLNRVWKKIRWIIYLIRYMCTYINKYIYINESMSGLPSYFTITSHRDSASKLRTRSISFLFVIVPANCCILRYL